MSQNRSPARFQFTGAPKLAARFGFGDLKTVNLVADGDCPDVPGLDVAPDRFDVGALAQGRCADRSDDGVQGVLTWCPTLPKIVPRFSPNAVRFPSDRQHTTAAFKGSFLNGFAQRGMDADSVGDIRRRSAHFSA